MSELKHCLQPAQISALLDGDLDADEAIMATAHMEHCADCQAIRDEMVALSSGLAELGKVEVPAGLFAEIERQHKQETGVTLVERLRRWWAVPVLATAGLAVALAVYVWRTPVPEATEQPRFAAVLQSVRQAEETYINAIEQLEHVADQDVDRFDPEVRATLRQGLAEIDRSIQQCRRVLHDSPDDIAAHQIMLAAYQQKVDFLNELVAHVPERR